MTGPAAGSELSLAALALRLRELSGQLNAMDGRLGTNEAAIQGVAASAAEAAGLAREVQRLAELMESGGAPASVTGEYPHRWATMSDEESVNALRYLARWVTTVLLVTYPHVTGELPACWPGHNAVVAELDWLCWAWEEIWAVGATAHVRDAADWHDRWLPGALERVRPLLAACNNGKNHVKPGYPRAVPAEYQAPPDGTSPEAWWPELEFIENMGRAEREELRRMGGCP